MQRMHFAWGLALCAATGCGAPEAAFDVDATATDAQTLSGSVAHGSVLGDQLEVKDAIYMRYPLRTGSGEVVETVSVLLSDKPELCRYLQADTVPRNMTVLAFTLQRGPNHAVNPGTYDVRAPDESSGAAPRGRAYAQFLHLDAHCNPELPASSTAVVAHDGTLELRGIRQDVRPHVEGGFDLSFGPQKDKVNGVFDASECQVKLHPFAHCVD